MSDKSPLLALMEFGNHFRKEGKKVDISEVYVVSQNGDVEVDQESLTVFIPDNRKGETLAVPLNTLLYEIARGIPDSVFRIPKFTLKEGTRGDWNLYLLANSSEPYGAGIIEYAENWAALMELRMAAGSEVHEVAEKSSHDADTSGITGFMHGVAVAFLAQLWVHGEDLRKWHNKKYGAKDSEGTVNPAVLTVGKSE